MNNLDYIKIIPMQIKHIKEILKIEKESFKTPWTKDSFENEIKSNKLAYYIIAINELDIIYGYAGLWHIINEGHITNIAVSKSFQNKGIATKMISHLIEYAKNNNIIGLTLEVRDSNICARKLYEKIGFIYEGVRPGYYQDSGEDALIMWKRF